MPAKTRSRTNPMAPYFVQLREFERRLIRDAFDAAGHDLGICAAVLGVHVDYVQARAKLLGGVFGEEPKHEPPGSAMDAWNSIGRVTKRRRPSEPAEPDPTPEALSLAPDAPGEP